MKTLIHTATAMLVVLLAVSCVKEDMTECRQGTAVTLRAGIASQQGDIVQAVIYAFGSDGRLLEARPTVAGRREVFDFPGAGTLTFDGWCNTSGVNVTPLAPGDALSQGMVSLVPAAGTGMYASPSDLFFGQTAGVSSEDATETVIYAYRMDARMTVTVIGLKEYAGFSDEDYSMTAGTTPAKIDFNGQYSGGPASYAPACSFQPDGRFVAPQYNLFPSLGQALTVRLYHGGSEVYEVSADSDGNPFVAAADQTLNVLIDFTDIAVDVSLAYSEWTEVIDWEKIFN